MSTAHLMRQCHIPASTLSYWVTSGVIRPSVGEPRGQRYDLWWSLDEAVAVRAIKTLRDTGCPMPIVRTVPGMVRDRPRTPGQQLHWDGGAALRWADLNQRRRLGPNSRRAKVAVFIPMDPWFKEAERISKDVDPDVIKGRWRRDTEARPRRGPFE